MAVHPVSALAPVPDLEPELARRAPRRVAPAIESAYPRQGEAILPRALARLVKASTDAGARTLAGRDLGALGAGAWNDLGGDESRHLGMLVVEQVAGALRRRPRGVLRLAMPDPAAAMQQLRLEPRTERVLLRWIAAAPGEGRWTVARYLSIPGFGARALVDVMAALESARAAGLPGALRPIGPAWSGARPARTAVPLVDARPFHAVEIGGARIRVAQPDVTAARTAYAIASRSVYNWGATTVRRVAEQLEVLVAGTRRPVFVEQILTAVATFQWLDRDRGWFWFTGRPNRLLADLAKVLAVAARVSSARLWTALCRARQGPETPPRSLLPSLCSALPGASIVDDVVVSRHSPGPVRLTHAEGRLVGIFRRSARPLPAAELRAEGRVDGLPWRTIRRLLGWSPLFEPLSGGRYALIGTT